MAINLLYARKSSEAEDRQAASIDSQIKELESTVIKNGRIEVRKPYYTESFSAKIPGRPEFNKMMNEIEEGGVKAVLCWKLNRLARNAIDGGKVIYAVTELGVEIITPAKIYTANDLLLMYVEFGMANQFISDLSKDTKRGLKSKAERGWLPSGAKPGYMNDKYAERGNKTIVEDPERFILMRKGWDMMLTGIYSPIQVLRKMNGEWGYRTTKHKRIGGKPMSRSQIYKTFTDPFYYGDFEYPVGSGNWYKGKHKPMISKEEYEKVQIFLGNKGRPRPRTHEFTYTGLLRCGECNAMITAEEKHQIICSECKYKFASLNKVACPRCQILITAMNKPTRLHYIYYHCTKRKKKECNQKGIRVEKFEKQFDALLERVQISENFKSWAIKYLNELADIETEDRNAIIQSQQAAYDECVKRIDNLVRFKISSQNSNGELLSDEEFRIQKEALLKEKASLFEKLQNADGRIDKWVELTEKTFNFACYARHWFTNGDRDTKKQILLGIGSNLLLKDGIVRVDLQKPLQFIEMAKNEVAEISPMFEPEKEGFKSGQIDSFYSKNPSLLPEPRINITIDFSSIINAFQDLRYIGELRQRWNEIKKLQMNTPLAFA
ncbi:MAG: hypothetical protein A2687_05905 [Candidatus Levybacteria bacterium RIFCSPHIGHO2_01_FULL_38_26]|nr:MAG: hypothetical protein A2687_05905 [Candidatus Levybacteria bacterium RIFCSPHIGHO2_01_FULL_38_26]